MGIRNNRFHPALLFFYGMLAAIKAVIHGDSQTVNEQEVIQRMQLLLQTDTC